MAYTWQGYQASNGYILNYQFIVFSTVWCQSRSIHFYLSNLKLWQFFSLHNLCEILWWDIYSHNINVRWYNIFIILPCCKNSMPYLVAQFFKLKTKPEKRLLMIVDITQSMHDNIFEYIHNYLCYMYALNFCSYLCQDELLVLPAYQAMESNTWEKNLVIHISMKLLMSFCKIQLYSVSVIYYSLLRCTKFYSNEFMCQDIKDLCDSTTFQRFIDIKKKKFPLSTPRRQIGVEDVQLHSFSASALD